MTITTSFFDTVATALAHSYTAQLACFAMVFFVGGLCAPRGLLGRLALVMGVTISVALIFASAFDLGETYRYSLLYKRNFFVFGDEISSALVAFLLVAIATQATVCAGFIGAGLLITGGKVALVMTAAALALLTYLGGIRWQTKKVLISVLLAAGLYMAANWISLAEGLGTTPTSLQQTTATPTPAAPATLRSQLIATLQTWGINIDGIFYDTRSVCDTVDKCLNSQIQGTLADRGIGIVGGLWMTLEGGYGGAGYPNSATKFADLMIGANPFGINTAYNITHADWQRVGRPENALANVGSSYGLLGFGALLWAMLWMIFLAIDVLRTSPQLAERVFASYIIVMFGLNQLQAYVMPWHYVFAVLLIACGVIVRWHIQNWADSRRHSAV